MLVIVDITWRIRPTNSGVIDESAAVRGVENMGRGCGGSLSARERVEATSREWALDCIPALRFATRDGEHSRGEEGMNEEGVEQHEEQNEAVVYRA